MESSQQLVDFGKARVDADQIAFSLHGAFGDLARVFRGGANIVQDLFLFSDCGEVEEFFFGFFDERICLDLGFDLLSACGCCLSDVDEVASQAEVAEDSGVVSRDAGKEGVLEVGEVFCAALCGEGFVVGEQIGEGEGLACCPLRACCRALFR